MPVAILDFGTNTFNLLIAEQMGSGFRVLYDGKQPVKLGKGGINKRMITPEAMERGFAAIQAHMQTIRKHDAGEIHQALLHSTTEERLNMPGMEPVRVEMIVPATIFINFVYHSCQLESITQSRYALKEGVMARLIAMSGK
jgi:exopolyphosphatase/pppGpp-phosphohydrolase